MDTLRILELLETTDPKKLAQLEKATKFAPTGAQSANEMLNEELFGTPAKQTERRAATESEQSSTRRSRPLTRTAKKGATESAGFRRANGYRSAEEPAKGAKECIKTPVGESDGGSIFDEPVDEKKAPKKRMNVGEGEGCEDGACGADECNAGESVVETGDSKFPEEFDFDAEAFAEEYSIDPETITCVFVEEDPDAKIAEHVELSFTYEESTVILSIYADSTVTETVDAEEVDAQFSANFAEEEDEDGNKQTVLHVDLIDEEGAEDATAEDAPADDAAGEDIDDGAAPDEGADEPTVDETAIYKSIIRKLTEVPDVPEAEDELREELEKSGLTEDEMNAVYAIKDEPVTDAVMSEGDADHKGEDGGNVTDEFIEEHGLDLDPVYSKDHGIPVAKGMDAGTMPGYRKEDKGVNESAASSKNTASSVLRQLKESFAKKFPKADKLTVETYRTLYRDNKVNTQEEVDSWYGIEPKDALAGKIAYMVTYGEEGAYVVIVFTDGHLAHYGLQNDSDNASMDECLEYLEEDYRDQSGDDEGAEEGLEVAKKGATEGWTEDDYSEKFGADNGFYFRAEMEAGGAGRELLADVKKFSGKYKDWDALKPTPAGIEVYHCGKKLGVAATESKKGATESLAAKIIRTSK